jgi:hypothetical protein
MFFPPIGLIPWRTLAFGFVTVSALTYRRSRNKLREKLSDLKLSLKEEQIKTVLQTERAERAEKQIDSVLGNNPIQTKAPQQLENFDFSS